jgi:hypothetical protein
MNYGCCLEGRRVREQGVVSRSSTKDECGWTFAPLSPKEGSPSKSRKRVVHLCKGLKTGKEGSRGEGLINRVVFIKVLYVCMCITAHVCSHLMDIVCRL